MVVASVVGLWAASGAEAASLSGGIVCGSYWLFAVERGGALI